jgi:hypothetical protein
VSAPQQLVRKMRRLIFWPLPSLRHKYSDSHIPIAYEAEFSDSNRDMMSLWICPWVNNPLFIKNTIIWTELHPHTTQCHLMEALSLLHTYCCLSCSLPIGLSALSGRNTRAPSITPPKKTSPPDNHIHFNNRCIPSTLLPGQILKFLTQNPPSFTHLFPSSPSTSLALLPLLSEILVAHPILNESQKYSSTGGWLLTIYSRLVPYFNILCWMTF